MTTKLWDVGGKANTQGNEMCALLRAIYYDILLASLLR